MKDIDAYYRGDKRLPSQASLERINVFDFLMDFRKDNDELMSLVEENGSWIEGGTSPDKRLLITSLILSLNAQVFVEIGLNSGIMAAAASRALAVTGGKYIGFELRPDLSFVSEFLENKFGQTLEMYWGSSADTVPTFIAAGGENTADIVFVDGDHSVEGVRADILNSLTVLKEGGLLVIDDSKSDILASEIKNQLDTVIWIPGLHPEDTGLCLYQK